MDISRKSLFAVLIINLCLIAISVVCMFVTKFNIVVLWLSVAMITFILISSVILFLYGKKMKK